MALCYIESPPGMATTVFALATCLAVLSITIQAAINAAMPGKVILLAVE
jgi:hypothetical protein